MTLHYDFFSDCRLGMMVCLLIAVINVAAVVIVIYLNVKSKGNALQCVEDAVPYTRYCRERARPFRCAEGAKSLLNRREGVPSVKHLRQKPSSLGLLPALLSGES